MIAPELAGPGWHTDPAGGEGVYRWWDGARWTDWLSDDSHAPAPSGPTEGAGSPPRRAAPLEPDDDAGPDLTSLAPPTGRPARMYPPGYERRTRRPAAEEPRPAGTRTPRILGAAALVVAAAVVVAVVVSGNRVPPDPLAGPLVSAPADAGSVTPTSSASSTVSGSPTPAALDYDAGTTKVTIGTFSAALPAAPYRPVGSAPRPVGDVLSSGVSAAATVQKDYDGARDWEALLSVGLLADDLVAEGDARKTARNVLAATNRLNFPGVELTAGKLTVSDVQQSGVERGAIIQGRMNYRVAKVDSRWDQVSILVVELHDGTWVGWMSSRPEKSSSGIKAALRDAISTITTSS